VSNNKRARDEFVVGLTVLIALVVLVGGIMWGKGVSFESDYRTLYVEFSEVYGLKAGSAVLVQGVAHGKVKDIELIDKGARVCILVDRGVVLYSDASALLFAPQLMSGRMVTISPGNGPDPISDGAVIPGEVPAGMGEVMAASGDVMEELLATIKQLHITAARIDTVLIQTEMVGRVEGTLGNLEKMTSNLHDNLSEAALSLRIGADEIRNSTAAINTMMGDNKPRLDTLMVRLNRVVGEAEQFSSNLENFSEAMNTQEGSLGKMVYSDSLHQQLQQTLQNLDALIIRLKDEGINVSLF